MFTLSKSRAKDLTLIHLTPFMEGNGFIQSRKRDAGIVYIKKNTNGIDGLALGYLDAFPGQKIRYVVRKRIDVIEEATEMILNKISPGREADRESYSLVFNPATISDLRTDQFMPEMENEEDVEMSVGLLKKFMTEVGLPLLDKYNDIKELDQTINGDHFWNDDWQMPFNTGGNFYIKRLIIADLANNGSFKNIVERVFRRDIELAKKYNLPTPSLLDKDSVLRITLEYLSRPVPRL